MTSSAQDPETIVASGAIVRSDLTTSVIAGVAAGGFAFLTYRANGLVTLPLGTMSLGALLIALRQESISGLIQRAAERFDAFVASRSARPGKVSAFVFRPIDFCAHQFDRGLSKIQDPHLRSGLRLVTTLVTLEAVLIAIAVSIMIAVGVLLFFVAAYMAIWILRLSGNLPAPGFSKVERVRADSPKVMPAGFVGTSRTRKPMFGEEYEEYLDEHGRIAYTAHRQKPVFGEEYTEFRNPTGEVVGRGELRDPIFGEQYAELTDAKGDVVGTSRSRDPLFGEKHIETTDADGNVVSKTSEIDPLFGETYREHRKP